MASMLKRIHVQGFKSLKDVTLDLGPTTVIIGSNGAGKSNLLAFFRMIRELSQGRLQHLVAVGGGASEWLHYGPKVTPAMAIELTFDLDGTNLTYEVTLQFAAGDRFILDNEYLGHRAPQETETTHRIIGTAQPESLLKTWVERFPLDTHEEAVWFHRLYPLLAGIRPYHFQDTSLNAPMRTASVGADDRVLRHDGGNLAAFLYRLKHSPADEDQVSWRLINRLVTRVAPSVHELRPTGLVPSEDPPSKVRLDWVDDSGATFGVHQLSDGTLRFIALVTALAQPPSTLPAFITIDEPELGLHPAALALVAELVRSVSTGCQVVLATQAPALMDHFEPEDVVVVDRGASASTFTRLGGDELTDWLKDYSLSELYGKNVLGGRP